MSESNSDSSNTESFDLIDDFNNEQRNDKLISPSLSSTSTDNIVDLKDEMDSDFKEKLIDKNQLIENSKLSSTNDQSIFNVAEKVSNNQITDKLDNFDNQKLQEQLNMQIQLNQQHLQFSNQQVQLNPQISKQQTTLESASPILEQQINPKALQETNQRLQQNQSQLNQFQPNQLIQPQLNLSELSKLQLNQIELNRPQLSQNQIELNRPQLSHNQTELSEQSNQQEPIKSTSIDHSSKEVAKLQSPISNFNLNPTSYLPNWFTKKDIFNKVAENSVSAFNSVLITLDPQMKEYEIHLGGGPSILVTSNHPFDLFSIRDGFLDVFKRATVKSIDHFCSIQTAAQLVGFEVAHKISLERVKGLRNNISIVPQNQIIVCIENFLYNFNERWFDSDYILLDDPLNNIQLSVHSQGTPIEDKYIEQLKLKASNHKFREDGFSIRIDNLIASDLNCSIGEWHEEYVGFDKSKLHYQAILLLSNLYRNKLKLIGRLNE